MKCLRYPLYLCDRPKNSVSLLDELVLELVVLVEDVELVLEVEVV